jgi:hypothetical protein
MADFRALTVAGLTQLLESHARHFSRSVERGRVDDARQAHAKATEVMGELLRRMEARTDG